jgi:hypothetical protein
MFFAYHGAIQYTIFDNEYTMSDITKVSLVIKKSSSVLQSINVDARTPEQIAYDVYGDSSLFWVILFVNNVVDPAIDWHMMEDQLYEYCVRIYGSDGMLKVRYFENTTTNEIITGDEAKQYYDMMANNILLPEYINYVTNYDYEQLLNENKKVVKIIPKTLISKFVEDFKNSLK